MSCDRAALHARVRLLGECLIARGWRLATAESCTGGGIAAAITDLPGSSAWFERGFVAYSNAAKRDMLGVPAAMLECHGAVSEPVARAMARGALRDGQARIAIAVTGLAGPGGGSRDCPVGTLCFGWALRAAAATEPWTQATTIRRQGDRQRIRHAAVAFALERLIVLARTDDGA